MHSFWPRAEKYGYRFLFLIIVLIVIVKIAVVAVLYAKNISPSPVQDPLEYRNLAANLLAGNGFSIAQTPPYLPDLFRTPLYPLFLAATYLVDSAGHFAILLQQLMAVASAWILFKILRSLRRDAPRIISLIFAFFLLADPRLWFWSLETMTETLFIFLTMLMFLFLTRYYENLRVIHAAGAGSVFGLALLTRPSGLLWLPALLVFFLFYEKPVKQNLAMLFVFLTVAGLVVSPWVWRNYKLVSRPVFSSAQINNYIQAFGKGRDDPAWACAGSIEDSKGRKGCVFYGWTSDGFSATEKTHKILRSNISAFAFMKKNTIGAYNFWSPVEYEDSIGILHNAVYGAGKPMSRTWISFTAGSRRVYAIFLNLIIILAVAGIAFLYQKKELAVASLLAGVILFSTFVNFGLASGRLHLVLFPPLFILAASGVVFIKRKLFLR